MVKELEDVKNEGKTMLDFKKSPAHKIGKEISF
jgi:hypothetical protein